MAEIYYKNIEACLFKVKTCPGWHIQADTIEDALGLANKRGNYKLEDLEQIGTCVAIIGKSPKYDDVINMRDQLEHAWALLGHEDAALTLCDVSNDKVTFCTNCGKELRQDCDAGFRCYYACTCTQTDC